MSAATKTSRWRRWWVSLSVATIAAIGLTVWVFAVPFPRDALSPEPVTSTRVVDENGVQLREVLSDKSGRARWLSLDEVSPLLVMATVHTEDERFYTHPGVDGIAIARAILSNLSAGRAVSGASTLTQQTVKLVLSHGRNRDLWDKADEAVWAIRLEQTLSKREILEQYLNRAPYGNQLFGIEAAARMYFDKPASQLSLGESAFLAGLPQAPTTHNPYRRFETAKRRGHAILHLMRNRGAIDEQTYERARAEPLTLAPKRAPLRAPHFVEHVLKTTRDKDGKTPTGEIVTTLDYRVQQQVEGIVEQELTRLRDRDVSQAAVVVLDNRDATVVAWVGSRDYFDAVNAGANDGVRALRQPGSTLKPFVYGLYLERGGTAADVFADLPTEFPTGDGAYRPRNYGRTFHGPVQLRDALGSSLNVPAVAAASELGPEAILERLHVAGFSSLSLPPDHYGLGIALGDGEVTLLELAQAYSALSRGGRFRAVRVVVDEDARDIDDRRVFDPGVTFTLLDVLSDDRARAVGFGTDGPLAMPFRVASKTGTSTGFRDNWAVGITPEHTVAVWVGNFDGSAMNRVSGARGASPILRQVFQALNPEAAGPDDVPWFRRPHDVESHNVCTLSGHPAGEHCPATRRELFSQGRAGASGPPGVGGQRVPGPGTCQMHREVAIDSRNNLLATDGCPTDVVERRVLHDLPANLLEWGHDHGVALAPTDVSPLCNGGELLTPPPAPATAGPVTIVAPLEGTRFVLDPELAAEAQTVSLRAHGPTNEALTWFINGEPLTRDLAPPWVESWQLVPGSHRIGVGRGRIETEVGIVVVGAGSR